MPQIGGRFLSLLLLTQAPFHKFSFLHFRNDNSFSTGLSRTYLALYLAPGPAISQACRSGIRCSYPASLAGRAWQPRGRAQLKSQRRRRKRVSNREWAHSRVTLHFGIVPFANLSLNYQFIPANYQFEGWNP